MAARYRPGQAAYLTLRWLTRAGRRQDEDGWPSSILVRGVSLSCARTSLRRCYALTVALLNVLYSQWSSRVNRRRNLYSEAYKAAMAWVEMVYRVRRRSVDMEDDLVERYRGNDRWDRAVHRWT